MKVVALLIIFVFVYLTVGDTYIINTPISERKSHPGMCYDEELDLFYANGTINQRPGLCEIARCLPDMSMQIKGCMDPSGPIFCQKIPANHLLPYPSCCARIKCM